MKIQKKCKSCTFFVLNAAEILSLFSFHFSIYSEFLCSVVLLDGLDWMITVESPRLMLDEVVVTSFVLLLHQIREQDPLFGFCRRRAKVITT
jgi:hypothetical protein